MKKSLVGLGKRSEKTIAFSPSVLSLHCLLIFFRALLGGKFGS